MVALPSMLLFGREGSNWGAADSGLCSGLKLAKCSLGAWVEKTGLTDLVAFCPGEHYYCSFVPLSPSRCVLVSMIKPAAHDAACLKHCWVLSSPSSFTSGVAPTFPSSPKECWLPCKDWGVMRSEASSSKSLPALTLGPI